LELKDQIYPGWTHMQAAQPLSWAQYLLAYVEMFHRDYRRLEFYLDLHSVSPLGAGALTGSSLNLDPGWTSEQLGFNHSFGNSYDVAGDREFEIDLVNIGATIMIQLSRLAEDFVYFVSTPVSWVSLPDAFCTGSSMMPQKKNPDVFELIRGKSATVIGHSNAIQVLLKGLPSSYQRDLQQDKEHLFPVADTVESTLEIVSLMIEGFRVRSENTEKALGSGFLLATDLAEYLVGLNVPFRRAHEKVGKLVRYCVDSGLRLEDLSFAQIQEQIPESRPDVIEVLKMENYLDRRIYKGSCGNRPIRERLEFWEEWIRDTELPGRED
jgi:argininosuccinate lyase